MAGSTRARLVPLIVGVLVIALVGYFVLARGEEEGPSREADGSSSASNLPEGPGAEIVGEKPPPARSRATRV